MFLIGQSPFDGYRQTIFHHLYPMPLVAHHAHGKGGDEARHGGNLSLLTANPLVDGIGNSLAGIVETFQHTQQIVYQQGCGSCWGLYLRVRYHVENRLVTIMTNARNDWQRELSHILCQSQCVETTQVGSGTTAPDDDDAVVWLLALFIDVVQRADD